MQHARNNLSSHGVSQRRFLFTLLAVMGSGITLLPGLRAQTPTKETVLFHDKFDKKLDSDWSWLREHEGYWRLRKGALEIRAEPGLAHNVKNALLRKAPDRSQGSYAIEVTVTNTTAPTQQYEQAGITWYHDGKPVFKLVKERIDGGLFIIPGRKPIENQAVQLRLVVTADRFKASYRLNGKGPFKVAAEGKLPPPGKDQVSIQCYHGPADAQHWMRFDDFRVLRISEK